MKSSGLLTLFCLCALVFMTAAHTCLMSPRQRGDMNLDPLKGHMTCFRRVEPCGGMTSETPKVTYTAGSTIQVEYQQMYNHYSVGFPGYMDIAWAQTANPVSDSEFTVVAEIPDFYPYRQFNQQNFTLSVPVPNIRCDHCVLRLRYVTHKPGEGIFYQCSDVKIAPPSESEADKTVASDNNKASEKAPLSASLDKYYADPATTLYGVSADGIITAVNILTGITTKLFKLPYIVLSPNHARTEASSVDFISDSVVTVDTRTKKLYYTGSHSIGRLPSTLVTVDLTKQSTSYTHLANLDKLNITMSFSSIEYDSNSGMLIGTALIPIHKDWISSPTYKYKLFYINPQNGAVTPIPKMETAYDDYFINHFWTTFDAKSNRLFVLAGNEHDPFDLSSRIYVFDINAGTVNYSQPDIAFTLSSIYYEPTSGSLVAVSPGKGANPGENAGWSVVSINPTNGIVKKLFDLKHGEQYTNYYGGNVYRMDESNHLLYRIFRSKDNDSSKTVLATIDVVSGMVRYSTGNSALAAIHNLALIA